MSLKAKTKKRLSLLLVFIIGAGAAGGGLFAFKQYRTNRRFESIRQDALAAIKKPDHARAVNDLAYYLSRYPDNVEILTLFSQERLLADVEDSNHLWDAIRKMRHLVELQPDNIEARRQLMQIYSRSGLNTESLAIADDLLKRNPADLDALKAKLAAHVRLREFPQAFAVAAQWCKISPLDPEPQLRAMALMMQMGRPPAEVMAWSKKFSEKDPDGPVSQLVTAVAYEMTGDLKSGRELLRKAAAQKLPSIDFTRLLVDQLNRAGLYNDSLALLEKLAPQSDAADLRQLLLRRMWELNRASEVIKLTEDFEKLDTEAKAFRALALVQLGKTDDAQAICDSLSAQTDNLPAKAWSLIVSQQIHKSPTDPRKLLDACQKAIRKDVQGGYLLYFTGMAYAELDEGELAIDIWQQVASMNQTWARPLVQLSEMRLAKERYALAMDAARMAALRAPGDVPTMINLARVWGANIESGLSDRPEDLLKLIAAIRKEFPAEEQTLGMQIGLLGSLGRRSEAIADMKLALEAKDAPSEQALLRMAAVSRAYGLGLEEQCFDRCEKAHGITPNLAYARALGKLAAKAPAAGLALLKDARAHAVKPDDLDWDIVSARYLEVIQDPGAKDAWIKLADAHPDNRGIQQLALAARSAHSDRDFINRTIDRLHAVTGDDALTWRLARARWMLEGAKNEQDLAQVSVLLKDILRVADDMVEPHALLAQTYERLNNPNGAIEQLRAAAAADPENPSIALSLSRLLQRMGEFDKAKEQLDRVAKSRTTFDQKRQAAALLAQQGDAQRAIELLQGSASDDKESGGGLLLAMLYRQRNELSKADEIVVKLLQNPDTIIIQFAADLYAQQGRADDAARVLALLDQMKLKPGIKELLLADHASRFLGPEETIKHFKASLAAAPDNASAWRGLIGYYAFLGRGNDFSAAAADAAKALPADPGLAEIAAEHALLSQIDQNPDTRPLVAAFIADARPESPILETMRVLDLSKRGMDSIDQTISKLSRIADDSPRVLQVQLALVQQCLLHGRPDEAARIATRAVQMFPTEVDSARLAVEALSIARRWNEALAFAQTWRDRTLTNPLPADMAIASTYMQLKQPTQAVAQLQPYIAKAMTTPDQSTRVIIQYASALNLAGSSSQSADMIWPLAQKSSEWRKIWVQLALECDPSTAASWLKRIETIMPAAALEERSILASAWHILGQQSKNAEYIALSDSMYSELLAHKDVPVQTALACGIIAEQEGDVPKAEKCYRQALSMQSDVPAAQNNLAMILARRGGDMTEALKLAQAAVDKHPDVATLFDTLAFVQSKSKNVDAAVANLQRALELEPGSLEWRVHLAKTFFDAGRRKEADKMMLEIAALPPGDAPPSDKTKQQLTDLKAAMSKQSSSSIQSP